MADQAEKNVSKFYNTIGWDGEGDITEDARRWEDLREHAQDYVSKCRLRLLKYIPEEGANILDMASGPIQYKEYLEFSKNFKKRYCIDLSSVALEKAKNKIGTHGVFLNGNFLDISVKKNFFDCAISLHTIYHMDKDRQEDAVRKLIDVTKLGKPVIIVYSNPNTFVSFLRSFIFFGRHKRKENGSDLYYYAYPLSWWNRFNDIADMKITPYRSFDSTSQKILFPNNSLGKKMFRILYSLEEKFPVFFSKHFQFPMIILTKK